MPNSSSRAITSSTVSSESAPRSSTKLASGVTSSSSTPNCSPIIFFTRSSTVPIAFPASFPILPPPFACEPVAAVSYNILFTESSTHQHPPIHMQYMAGDVGCLVRHEKTHRCPNVSRGTQSSQRDLFLEHVFYFHR